MPGCFITEVRMVLDYESISRIVHAEELCSIPTSANQRNEGKGSPAGIRLEGLRAGY
jgi:hypothetical protein